MHLKQILFFCNNNKKYILHLIHFLFLKYIYIFFNFWMSSIKLYCNKPLYFIKLKIIGYAKYISKRWSSSRLSAKFCTKREFQIIFRILIFLLCIYRDSGSMIDVFLYLDDIIYHISKEQSCLINIQRAIASNFGI